MRLNETVSTPDAPSCVVLRGAASGRGVALDDPHPRVRIWWQWPPAQGKVAAQRHQDAISGL
jgi:hypothetical protein